jgi:hypothetical protein
MKNIYSIAVIVVALVFSVSALAAAPIAAVVTQAQLVQGVARILFPDNGSIPGHPNLRANDTEYCGGDGASGLFLVELKSTTEATSHHVFTEADCQRNSTEILETHPNVLGVVLIQAHASPSGLTIYATDFSARPDSGLSGEISALQSFQYTYSLASISIRAGNNVVPVEGSVAFKQKSIVFGLFNVGSVPDTGWDAVPGAAADVPFVLDLSHEFISSSGLTLVSPGNVIPIKNTDLTITHLSYNGELNRIIVRGTVKSDTTNATANIIVTYSGADLIITDVKVVAVHDNCTGNLIQRRACQAANVAKDALARTAQGTLVGKFAGLPLRPSQTKPLNIELFGRPLLLTWIISRSSATAKFLCLQGILSFMIPPS